MQIRRPVLITFNVIVEITVNQGDNIFEKPIPIYNQLVDTINDRLKEQPEHYGYKSSRFVELDFPGGNSGRCSICAAWVTDIEKPDPIEGLQPGATVDGKLLCDDCLPKDHRWAF